MSVIIDVYGREILDSRGNPTVEVEVVLEDGSFGTSFEKISNAIDQVYSEDGVILLMDMGSAVMTAEMVIESMEGRKLAMADCPIAEGAVTGTVGAEAGMSLEDILEDLEQVGTQKKL